jgi:glycosyltransferase involved in cell wall biosynthesis
VQRVLHVAQPTTAGVAGYVAGLCRHQVARGWQVTVAAPRGGLLQPAVTTLGARHVEWNAGRSPDHRVALEIADLTRIVRVHGPDVLHLHSSKAGLAGRLAPKLWHKTVFQPHGWSFLAAGRIGNRAALAWERIAARRSDAIVCVSEREREIGAAAGIRCRYESVVNGVDIGEFRGASRPERESIRLRLGMVSPVVVCVGRLCAQKGQDTLLEAWPLVQRELPTASLVLVGDGPMRNALEARAPRNVRFEGEQTNVRDWLVAADVVVFPSRWEGMSLALLEAMACGQSVVATDVAGARQALRRDAGEIVDPGDREGLARALNDRLSNPEKCRSEGRRGRARVESVFDFDTTAASITDLYQSLTERSRLAHV